MIILGIETSCDETAVCLLEANGGFSRGDTAAGPGDLSFKVLANALYSQVKIHAKYGGVFPMLAKREHAKNLPPLLEKVLDDAKLAHLTHENKRSAGAKSANTKSNISEEKLQKIKILLERESGLYEHFIKLISNTDKPAIDAIAVTAGPGLEPALWVGINFALALGEAWDIPVFPTNHMAGHLFSPLVSMTKTDVAGTTDAPNSPTVFQFPVLALLISGGHTELVVARAWRIYEVIGQTRDDAVGEAFDKVARLLGLPYPGGPEISRLAKMEREKTAVGSTKNSGGQIPFSLPRPMLTSDDFDFSFSGLKTAVLYLLKKFEDVDDDIRRAVAREFEDAATEVLVAKTKKAIDVYEPRTLVVAGGVSANAHIRAAFENLTSEHNQEYARGRNSSELTLLIPPPALSTDNAVMIAVAGYIDFLSGKKPQTAIQAKGTLAL